MTNKEYADLLLPGVEHNWEYYEEKYKDRILPHNAMVTRFAPSPTGFVHMGSLLSAMTNLWFAKQSSGIVFLRIEDTDQKREVENGVQGIFNDFNNLEVLFDEDLIHGGNYGPYIQSQRKDIYQSYAKKLIEQDLAYPCFCSHEEIDKLRSLQETKKIRIGYYGKYAKCRFLTKDEVLQKIKNKEKYIIRFKSPGSFYNKCILNDCIRGKIEMPENDIDDVIIKSDGLPTYHFAHVIDDHLMHTTHVMRGDEWISSYPKHEQLFKMLKFDLPNFAHLSPVNIKDADTIRKISKRKDPWAAISYYDEKGIPNDAIKLYLATLANSNFEEWYNNNPDKGIDDFVFDFSKMSITGPLFDIEKLNNISKTYFSRLSAEEIYNNLVIYTQKYDRVFYDLINKNKEYMINILNIERDTDKPRKDISAYEDVKKYFWYMFDQLFDNNNDDYEELTNVDKMLLINYVKNIYNENDDEETWFNNLKSFADQNGYTSDRKSYKTNPDNFKGTTADFCKIIRVIITKKNQSPNLYDIIKLIGKNRLEQRINKYFEK